MSIFIKGYTKESFCNAICRLPADCRECPVQDIPTPHGRLIDSDKLVRELTPDPWTEMGCPEPEGMEEFCMWLDMADTVLEEEI